MREGDENKGKREREIKWAESSRFYDRLFAVRAKDWLGRDAVSRVFRVARLRRSPRVSSCLGSSRSRGFGNIISNVIRKVMRIIDLRKWRVRGRAESRDGPVSFKGQGGPVWQGH